MNKKTKNIVLIVASATILFGIVTTALVLGKARKQRKELEKNNSNG